MPLVWQGSFRYRYRDRYRYRRIQRHLGTFDPDPDSDCDSEHDQLSSSTIEMRYHTAGPRPCEPTNT